MPPYLAHTAFGTFPERQVVRLWGIVVLSFSWEIFNLSVKLAHAVAVELDTRVKKKCDSKRKTCWACKLTWYLFRTRCTLPIEFVCRIKRVTSAVAVLRTMEFLLERTRQTCGQPCGQPCGQTCGQACGTHKANPIVTHDVWLVMTTPLCLRWLRVEELGIIAKSPRGGLSACS